MDLLELKKAGYNYLYEIIQTTDGKNIGTIIPTRTVFTVGEIVEPKLKNDTEFYCDDVKTENGTEIITISNSNYVVFLKLIIEL